MNQRNRTLFRLSVLSAAAIPILTDAIAVAVVVNVPIALNGTQIINGQEWKVTAVPFPQQLLRKGAVLSLVMPFTGGTLSVRDTFTNGDEHLNFFFGGSGGVGGGSDHNLRYNWAFIKPTGNLLVNPVVGDGALKGSSGNGFMNPSGPEHLVDVDLTTDEFCFGGIRLTVFVPNTIAVEWAPSQISLQVIADNSLILKQASTFLGPAGGSYQNASLWDNGVPNGAGHVADFGTGITSFASIALDGAVTLGQMHFSVDRPIQINGGTGGSLTFDASGSKAVIAVNGDAGYTFNASTPVTIVDNLLVQFNDDDLDGQTGVVNFQSTISEAASGRMVKVQGNGIKGGLARFNTANTYTGGLVVDDGMVELNHPEAQGPVGSTATAMNGAEIRLNFAPSASLRYVIGAESMISGTSARLAALDATTNLAIDPDAIIGHMENGSAIPANLDVTQYYFGVAAGGLSDNLTVGSNSGSYKGIYGGRLGDQAFLGDVHIIGDAEFGTLGGRRLLMFGQMSGGSAFDVMVFANGLVQMALGGFNHRVQINNGATAIFGGTKTQEADLNIDAGGTLQSDFNARIAITGNYTDAPGAVLATSPISDIGTQGIHFTGNRNYTVNADIGPDASSTGQTNIGADGPNTHVTINGGVWVNRLAQTHFFTLQQDAQMTFGPTAEFFTRTDSDSPGFQFNGVVFDGRNGGGQVNFDPKFVANPSGTDDPELLAEGAAILKSATLRGDLYLRTTHSANLPPGGISFTPAAVGPPAAGGWTVTGSAHDYTGVVFISNDTRFNTDVTYTQSDGGVVIDHAELTKTGSAALRIVANALIDGNGPNLSGAGGRLCVSEGEVSIESNSIFGANQLRRFHVNGGATLSISSNLSMRSNSASFTTVSRVDEGGVLEIVNDRVNSGRLNLRNTHLVYDYSGARGDSPLATIVDHLTRGYADGAWDGPGINSSSAAADPTRALGIAEASDVLGPSGGTFLGEAVDGSAVLVRFTRYGDANLDGIVNLSDFNRLAANFGSTNALWSDGDFTYDGIVNLADFNRLAGNFGLSASGPDVTPGDWANLASAVPEPGAMLAPMAGAVLALSRRRRAARAARV